MIKANFTRQDVKLYIDNFLDAIVDRQISRMRQLGEMCLVEARQNKGYMMQTGALLSSTGYQVYVDGVAVHSRFDVASGAESNAAQTGMNAGATVADAVGKETQGVALVMVAGMNYASYVEAKGKNVLTSAERLAERQLPVLLDKLANNIRSVAD